MLEKELLQFYNLPDEHAIELESGKYTLSAILNETDDWWETNHDFIQWVFPTNKPSAFNENCPIIENDRCLSLINLDTYRLCVARIMLFLMRTKCLEKSSHNDLRLTRVLESARLIISNEYARTIFIQVLKVVLPENRFFNNLSYTFWLKAVS